MKHNRLNTIAGSALAGLALAAPAAQAESVPAEVAVPSAGAYKVCVGSGNELLNGIANIRCTDSPLVQSGTLRLDVEYERRGTPVSELVFVDNAPEECGEQTGVAIRSNPNTYDSEGEAAASASLTGLGTDGVSVYRDTGTIKVLSGTYRFAYACNLPAEVPAAEPPSWSAPQAPERDPGDDQPAPEPERQEAEPQPAPQPAPQPQPAPTQEQQQQAVLGVQSRALDLQVLFRRQRLSTVLARGYRLQVVCTVDCAVASEIRASSARTSRLVVLGRTNANATGGKRVSITVPLNRAARTRLRGQRRAAFRVTVRVRDAGGQSRTLTQKVLLAR